MLAPLRARGRTLGVMALGFAEVVGQDHVELFEDLARRAALAIDNARLYEERANVARTLQRSLLPPVLPDVPGVELAARYVAAGEGNEVGGDFYDCFRTGDGEWAVVIGDVCGKGAEAAAVTALARYTVRASATLHSDSPGVVLQDLNDAIRRETPHSRFCTVLYVSLALHGDRVTGCIASGGHPLPLILRADGRVETAGLPGTLLGILPDPEIRPQNLVLRPGDSMILYTDGVIEASPLDHRFGPEQLAARGQRVPRARADRHRASHRGRRARRPGRHGARRRRRAGAARLPAARRAVCRGRAGGSGFHVKLLVLTPEPVDANLLRSVLGEEVEGAEVLVVSPATNQSPVAFWVSDSDDAIEEAEAAQEETVERLEEEGVDAAGDTGESEPAVAIQDALATFDADRIVVFSHPEGDRDYREDEGLADAEARFGVPLSHALIER